jgi:RNA polymerase sigma-70 factor (ECF subfamily)
MEKLQARLARGDPAAFAELYDTYAQRVGHYLLVRIGSRHDADDVLQETFCRLARNRRKLAAVIDLDAYVLTIARNEAARLTARRTRRRAKETPLAGDELFCCQPNNAEIHEIAELVAAALGRLSVELREVVELKMYAGLTFAQISEVTGLPQGTVATRYRTALSKMQYWLTREP